MKRLYRTNHRILKKSKKQFRIFDRPEFWWATLISRKKFNLSFAKKNLASIFSTKYFGRCLLILGCISDKSLALNSKDEVLHFLNKRRSRELEKYEVWLLNMTEIQKGVLFLSEIDSFSPGPTGWFQKVKESSDHKRYYYHGSYKNCHKSSSREGLTK